MSKTGRLATVVVLALAVAAVVVPRLRSSRSEAEPTGGAPAGPPRVSVVVHTVRAEPLTERIAATGTLRANEQIEVTSEIAGQAVEVRFREGTAVRAGDVLLTLNDGEARAQRDRALHRVELAKSRETRQRELQTDGLVSEQEYDVVRTELEVLRAELALAEAQLAKTVVRAPFDGVVGLRYVSPGAFLTRETRIATLQDLDPMKVDFAVPERYADRVRAGQRVEISVAGIPERFSAEIYAIEPEIEAATRSLVVRARTANPGGRLRSGMFADVSVVVSEVPRALTVPSIAVIPELGGKKVMLVADGKAAARKVETGIRTESAVQVTAGLAEGDRVVVRGIERVNDGTPVDVVGER